MNLERPGRSLRLPCASASRLKTRVKPKQTGTVKATFKVTSENAGGKTV